MENRINNIKSKSISEDHLGGYIPGGDRNTWFPRLWKWIVRELDVRSVLDIGCGEGHAIKYFRKLGCDVLGIDGSSTAIRDNVAPQNVVKHDFCKGDYTPNKKYDMIWSCEFVEHVDPKYLNNFLKTFKSINKYIFMTHAQPGQKGWHHVNCKSDEYWIKILSKIGVRFDPELTRIARALAQRGYFAKSGLVFVKNDFPLKFDIIKKKYPKYLILDIKIIDDIKFGFVMIYKVIDKYIGILGKLLNKFHPRLYFFLKKLKNKI